MTTKANNLEVAHNVFTFHAAIITGYEPSDYTYDKDEVPTGNYHVELDFMIWAKKVAAIDLFCTAIQTGQKIRLTVFRDKQEKYRIGQTEVPFLPLFSTLAIEVELNGKGKPRLTKIMRVRPQG